MADERGVADPELTADPDGDEHGDEALVDQAKAAENDPGEDEASVDVHDDRHDDVHDDLRDDVSDDVHDDLRGDVHDDVRDELPEDLDVSGFVGPYKFPDNSRRRIPGVIYLVIAALCVLAFLAWHDSTSGLVNGGFLLAAAILAGVGVLSITSGWHLGLDEKQALVAATKEVGFPVGHASAQLTWRGLRSRPTWRILLYSIENPPRRRGLVQVDAVDGRVVEHFVEDNPEDDWTEPD